VTVFLYSVSFFSEFVVIKHTLSGEMSTAYTLLLWGCVNELSSTAEVHLLC